MNQEYGYLKFPWGDEKVSAEYIKLDIVYLGQKITIIIEGV